MLTVAAVLAVTAGTVSAYYKPDYSLPWMNKQDSAEQRASILVQNMNVTEKIHCLHGSGTDRSAGTYVGGVGYQARLNIPEIRLNDGPQGFRDQNSSLRGTSTAWPSGLTIGSTFDTTAALLWGQSMGEEFLGKGANVQLGPGVCLARVPQCGRAFEYISGGDPFLGKIMVQPAVEGIQSYGVVANAKHYILNNQETDRTTVTAAIDERTFFEMYMPPFEGAANGGVGSIMCSYNKISYDGKPTRWSCENNDTLAVDYKKRVGFEGWVMSDWGATHSTSINDGLDQEMPGASYMGGETGGQCTELCAAVKDGQVTMAKLDDSVQRIFTQLFKMGVFDRDQSNTTFNNVTSAAHNQVARELAARSTILLKNDGGVLPINITSSKYTIAVIGSQAQNPIVHGGGSGQVFPYYTSTPLDALYEELGITPPGPPPNNCSEGKWTKGIDYYNQDGQTEASATSAAECCQLCASRSTPCAAFSFTDTGDCYMKSDAKNPVQNPSVTGGIVVTQPTPQPVCNGELCVYFADGTDVSVAQQYASKSDIAMVFVATTSHEGADRTTLDLDDPANTLIPAIAQAQPKTAVFMVHPGPVNTPFRTQVPAIVANFMPGQEYGHALMDVVFGRVNPAARLPLTFPAENQTVLTPEQWPGINLTAQYSEKLNVDYRYYDSHGMTPAFPFGHGLSYTSFEYMGLQASRGVVTFQIRNSGHVAGAEVPQVYLGFPSAAGEPPKQLKGFQHVMLSPGASAQINVKLDDSSVSIWDATAHDWTVVSGTYTVYVGASSADIRLTGSFTI